MTQLEDAVQFDLIIEEYLGITAKTNQWKVGCSYVNCPFAMLFDYCLELGNDCQLHERFTVGNDRYNCYMHVHDET